MGKRNLTLSVDDKIYKKAKIISINYDVTLSSLFEQMIKAIDKTNGAVIKAIQDINNK